MPQATTPLGVISRLMATYTPPQPSLPTTSGRRTAVPAPPFPLFALQFPHFPHRKVRQDGSNSSTLIPLELGHKEAPVEM